jgi:fumarylacetoacetase
MDQELSTFVPVPANSDFTIYNIPFGVASTDPSCPFSASRIGDVIINLRELEATGLLAS